MIVRGEGFEFDFTDAIDAFLFDQQDASLPNYHDLPDFSRVDFIVELPEDILFIEVKDPSNPNAKKEQVKKFVEDIKNDNLIWNLHNKYQHTFYFRWAEQKLSKNIHFLVLVTIEPIMTNILSDKLKRYFLPLWEAKSSRWSLSPLKTCQALNMETWNKQFPKWPVKRV